jgi:threonine/homoserine/homoserine lactone efflux protein
VLLEVVGGLLPAAAGIALSPFPIVAVILVVGGPRGRVAGPAFALGWLLGLSMLTAVAVGVGELLAGGQAGTWAAWARILLGAVLLGLGVRKGLRRPRGDEPAMMPSWMAGLAAATPSRAGAVGFGLAAFNPKNVAFALASASVIGQVDQDAGSALLEAAVFVLLASTTVVSVVVVGQVGGPSGERALDWLRQRLLRHNAVIVAVVLLLIGATILGDGLTDLG